MQKITMNVSYNPMQGHSNSVTRARRAMTLECLGGEAGSSIFRNLPHSHKGEPMRVGSGPNKPTIQIYHFPYKFCLCGGAHRPMP